MPIRTGSTATKRWPRLCEQLSCQLVSGCSRLPRQSRAPVASIFVACAWYCRCSARRDKGNANIRPSYGSVASVRCGRTARPLRLGQAATPKTWWTKARWAGMSSLGTARTCPFASVAMASTPARVRSPSGPKALKAEHRPCSALDAAVVLLDQVVQPLPAAVPDERQSLPSRFISCSAPG
jgi:hypothetical protein